MIDPRRYTSLQELLTDAFATYPSDVACIEADRDRERMRWTYADLRDRVRAIAAFLAAHAPNAPRVGIVAANQPGWLAAAAATFHRGGVLVPLDARMTPEEVGTLLAHAEVDVLVVDHHLAKKLSWRPELVLTLGAPAGSPLAGTVPFEQALACTDAVPELIPRSRDDVAAIVYSSGTGGAPKGCQLTHGNYLSQYGALASTFDWRRGDRYLSILPTNHAIDFMCGFVASFATGATVVHQRTLRPDAIVATMKRYRVTQMSVVPLVLEAFRRALEARLDQAGDARRWVDGLASLQRRLTPKRPNHALARWLVKPVHDAFGGQLRVIFCGGAPTSPDLARFFTDLGLPVAIGYGLTEACTVVTVNDLHPPRHDTVGATVPQARLRITDAGPDGVGEVQVAGPTVFAGYLREPELTAEAFTEDGWLRTGDLGWLDGAHHLHLVGRARNMIVTPGGKNVYPEDVEGHLDGTGAEELCVAAKDFVWPRRDGLGHETLVAIVRAADRDAVRHALAVRNRALPEHKRIGGIIWCEQDFPRTASLKVKRDALAEHLRTTLDRDAVEALR